MPDTKQKDPQALQSYTGQLEIIPTESISQTPKNMSIALDSFKGTVKEFKAHIRLNRILVENGLVK